MKTTPFFLLLAVVFILAACGGTGNSAVPASQGASAAIPAEYVGKTNSLSVEAVVAGAKIYEINCASCHGEGGLGDGPISAALTPPPANLVELSADAADDYLFWKISDGSVGTSMVPWKSALSEENIWQVITFIRSLK